jgi:hypothetical protein
MTFEGQQMQGSAKIMEKLGSLTFQKIAHLVILLDMFKVLLQTLAAKICKILN